MGRTNGKLIPFLKNGLIKASYINLRYQDVESEVFFIKLPRYGSSDFNIPLYERMLVDWYKFGEKEKKYESYSKAKSVFQASLNKSLYLVKLPSVEKKLLFRFATKEEINEKRKLLKEKATATYSIQVMLADESIVANDVRGPPSICSSGYHSAEDIEEPIFDSELNEQENNSFDNIDQEFINQFLDTLEKTDSDFFNDIRIDDLCATNDRRVTSQPTNQPCMNDDLKNIQLDGDLQKNLVAPSVVELNAIHVTRKLYWSCTRKLNLDSTLMLICERKVIEDGTNILEDAIIFPHGVWEPGITYDLKKMFELEGKMYLFFSFNSV